MTEHRIRFRGGWQVRALDGPPDEAHWLTLPLPGRPEWDGPVRLTRRFGRPPIDPETEVARLELRGVDGLRGLSLDGVDLPLPPPGVDAWDVLLPSPLAARNTLVLEVDPSPPPRDWPEGGWGAIALVIGPAPGPDARAGGPSGCPNPAGDAIIGR